MAKKKIRVMIELPANWYDADSPIGYSSQKIRDVVISQVRDGLVRQYLDKIKLPDIKFSKDELREAVKHAMVERLADKAMRDF